MSDAKAEVTLILGAIADGDPASVDRLLPLVYGELRSLANHLMTKEPGGQTLQPTALVHEAFLRLVGDPTRSWESRKHFFNASAMAMRRILIDRSRRPHVSRQTALADDGAIDIGVLPVLSDFVLEQMETLDEALAELGRYNPRWLEVAQLRYFIGLTIEQTAEMLGLSPATVKVDWQFARAWLKHRLRAQPPESQR